MGEVGQWPAMPPPPAPVTRRPSRAERRENLRAGFAQVSAVLPLLGPLLAFALTRHGSFGRREAAKAFNGQIGALLAILAGAPPLVVFWGSTDPPFSQDHPAMEILLGTVVIL